MDTGGFWEGRDDWNQEGLIESSALYSNRKQDIKWQTNGPPRLLRSLLLYKVNWSAFHGSDVAFRSSNLYPLAMANWAMSEGDKWAGRRDKKGWIRTQRSYFSSFSQLPAWKTDSKQGEFHTQERCALEVQPMPATPAWLHWNTSSVTPRPGRVLRALSLPLFSHAYQQADNSY